MEAIGIATGVIGLVPLCANGCSFIVGLCKAHGRVQEQMIRIRMQRGVLKSWAYTWDINVDSTSSEKKATKIQKWIGTYPELGMDVLDTLSAISDVFADTSTLEKKYGITLKRRDPALRELDVNDLFHTQKGKVIRTKDVESRRHHMNIVNRCHFELKGGPKFDSLIAKIIEYVDSLLKMCSEVQAEKIERALMHQVAASNDPGHLRDVSKVYGEEANRRRNAGQRHRGYELIKDVADFKARVQSLAAKRAQEAEKRRNANKRRLFLLSSRFLNQQDFEFGADRWKFMKAKSTLAVEKQPQLIRYMEWKSYADELGNGDLEAEGDILELADFLGLKNRPSAFRVLPCLGICRDEPQNRFAFIFQPPTYIERIPSGSFTQGGVSGPRMPRTLQDMLEQGPRRDGSPGILPLGDRFRLACSLAQSLYVMHATGWVHKNIRSSSVLFLPAESTYGGQPSTSGTIDIANPNLCGFGHSRPEHTSDDAEPPRPGHAYRLPTSKRAYDITLDIYHHPAKRTNIELRYLQAFDLYSLGTVLLEIGLWQTLETFEMKQESFSAFQRRLIAMALRELPGQVGQIYANAVKECLSTTENDKDEDTQQKLCWNVVSMLDQCVA